jgi:hypothetical protein
MPEAQRRGTAAFVRLAAADLQAHKILDESSIHLPWPRDWRPEYLSTAILPEEGKKRLADSVPGLSKVEAILFPPGWYAGVGQRRLAAAGLLGKVGKPDLVTRGVLRHQLQPAREEILDNAAAQYQGLADGLAEQGLVREVKGHKRGVDARPAHGANWFFSGERWLFLRRRVGLPLLRTRHER